MPTFDTPEPIAVRIEAGAGLIRLVATDRNDTVVRVRPRDESRSSDVWAAEHTRVVFRDNKLVVSGAKRGLTPFGGGGIGVDVALPSRSRLHVSLASADMRAEGEFADIRFAGSRTASGSVHVAEAVRGGISAHTSSGEVAVGAAEGTAVRLDIITGSGVVANTLQPSDGPEAGDETFLLHVRSGSGDVDVHRAHPAHQTVGG